MDDSSEWGRVYVNRRCCGAATCRNLAPELLGEVGPTPETGRDGPVVLPDSYAPGAFTGVLRQPRTREEFLAVRTAAAACPFGAIELERPRALSPEDRLEAPWKQWPRRLEDEVWAMGHPSKDNLGAMTYFIERPEGGVLVDPPKPSEAVCAWLEAHGGVRWLVFTHRDHSHHLAEFMARFPQCVGVMSAEDVNAKEDSFQPITTAVQVKLGPGTGPMRLDGSPLPEEELASADFALLPQPGHTPGSICLVYRNHFLFTGDHMSYSRRLGHPISPRLQCWQDWELQSESVGRMAAWAERGLLRFSWILPGHGDWHRFEGATSAATTAQALRTAHAWMLKQPPGHLNPLRFYVFLTNRMKPEGRLARFVRVIGGESADTGLLPSPVRHYLSDHDPVRTRTALRRVYALGTLSLLTVLGLAWWGVRLVGSLWSQP